MDPRPVPQKILTLGIGIPVTYTAPEGREDSVGNLPALFLEDTLAMLQQRPQRDHKLITWWQPTEKELEKLKKGAAIRITFIGVTDVNPMRVEVANSLEGLLFQEDGSEFS